MASADNPMRGVIFDGVKVGCGPLHHDGSVTDAFPLLPREDVFDIHVLIFQLMCFGGFLIAGFICRKISLRAWSQMRYRERAPWALMFLGILLSFIIGHIAYFTLAMGRAENYFVCEGVQGQAIGDTFPVPSCFDDHTNVGARSKDSSSCSTPVWREPVGGATIVSFVTALVCIVPAISPLLVRHMHQQKTLSNQRALPGGDLTAEESEALNIMRNNPSALEDCREGWAEDEPDTGVAMVRLRRQNI